MFSKLRMLISAVALSVVASLSALVVPTVAEAANPTPWLICASASHTGASMATLTQKSFTLTCPGAAVGDFVEISAPTDLLALTISGYVNAANTVTIIIANVSSGSVTDPTTVYYVALMHRYVSP